MWQDDALLLRLARTFQGYGLTGLLWPAGSPLRRLYTLPYRLALATPQVVLTLHVLYGAIWLGHALVAGWISRQLLPESRLTRVLAICLTLTATSDYLTNNLTALGYNFGAFLFLLALGCSLRYLDSGNVAWVAAACLTATASVWTIDVGIPALPFVPLLLFWRGGRAARRRILLVLAATGLVLAPAAIVEWRFLHDPSSYAAVAMQPIPFPTRLDRISSLWCDNFAPWRWVFARTLWYPWPPHSFRMRWMLLAAIVACLAFLVRVRGLREPAVESPRRVLSLTAIFAAMALFANAAYAGLQMADVRYRTHILSRVWASLAVAVLCGWAIERWPRFRRAILCVPLLFIGFGVWGGLERQDLWVSTWRVHKKELLSIVETAPAVTPHTGIILCSGPTPELYLATEANYLAQSWMVLLYDDPAIHSLRIAPDRDSGCRAADQALECWDEGQATCLANGTCAPDRFPYESLLLMDFDRATGTWHLVPSARGDLLLGGSPEALARYRPALRIVNRPLTPRQRALLLE
jgi:hypothetical protein